MEGTVALKIALRARGVLKNATVRSPLIDLSAQAEQEIEAALKEAGII
jgi:4-hydroxy-tetrahydrodipicolinate synthase